MWKGSTGGSSPARSSEQFCDFFNDRGRLAEPSGSDIAAGQPAFFRPDEAVPVLLELGDVFLGYGVLPHAVVHGGCKDDGAGGGVDHEADQIIANPVGR